VESVDKRFERSWLSGLKTYFAENGVKDADNHLRGILIKRGDVIAVPVWPGTQVENAEQGPNPEPNGNGTEQAFESAKGDDVWANDKPKPSGVCYLIVTSLSYDPLVPLEEDFTFSTTSKARAGELGCWVHGGGAEMTKIVLLGVERGRVLNRGVDGTWHGTG
jgi:peroxin-6